MSEPKVRDAYARVIEFHPPDEAWGFLRALVAQPLDDAVGSVVEDPSFLASVAVVVDEHDRSPDAD